MAYDKVVDSAKLDAGMTATANAIRAKTGGTEKIPWDSATGFKTAVEEIQTGGGTEDLSAELEAQDALISALEEAVAGKAAGGGTVEPPNIQPLSVTENGTYAASGDVDGYSPIVVNVPKSEMPPTVEQATPSIEVSSSGKITATATQTAGYVVAGTKTATKQLTTKGATTVTPGSTEQTVVQAGTYVTGDIKVSAVASGGGNGGDTGDLQYCILNNWYLRGGVVPPTLIIYFKPGWTWSDFIASSYNRWIPCEISDDAYRPTSYNTQPSALLEAKNNEVRFSGKSNFLIADWDNFILSTPTDSIIPEKTYYWD